MSFNLSQKSLDRLKGVNADLVAVVKRAIQISEVDFMVVQGLRTREECMVNYGKGRSAAELAKHGIPASYAKPALGKVTWLKDPFASKHVSGQAVDLLPAPYDWKVGSNFTKMANAMKQAAQELGVKMTWGGDWKTSKDYPHFEV